jgi:hypothetical protein
MTDEWYNECMRCRFVAYVCCYWNVKIKTNNNLNNIILLYLTSSSDDTEFIFCSRLPGTVPGRGTTCESCCSIVHLSSYINFVYSIYISNMLIVAVIVWLNGRASVFGTEGWGFEPPGDLYICFLLLP